MASRNASKDKHEPQSLFHEHSKHLPPFFAENILYLEMEVECNNVTIEVVNQLLELYRIGVEYFESIKSNKFLIFKNKTQQLLLRGTVNQCMNVAYEELKHETALKKSRHSDNNDPPSLPPVSPKVVIVQKSQKQQELENQLKYIKEQSQQLQVNQLIESHGYESQRVTRMHNMYNMFRMKGFVRIAGSGVVEIVKKKNEVSQIEWIIVKNYTLFQQELRKLEPHPSEYVEMKTKYLEQMSQLNYSKINQLPFITVAKAQHRQLLDKVKCYQFEENKQLSTSEFNTLFEEEKINKTEQLREEYYKQFILAPQQEEMSKKEIEKNRYLHVCGVINSQQVNRKEYQNHISELRELQFEINKLQQQNKVYVPAKEMCRNPQLISKVATSMLNMYNVYFKEIFDCLIDEILLDEVICYLQQIQYLNEQSQTPQKEQSDNEEEAQIDDVKDLLKHLGNMLEDY